MAQAAKAKPNVHVGLAGLEASGSRRGVETILGAFGKELGIIHAGTQAVTSTMARASAERNRNTITSTLPTSLRVG